MSLHRVALEVFFSLPGEGASDAAESFAEALGELLPDLFEEQLEMREGLEFEFELSGKAIRLGGPPEEDEAEGP